MIPNFIGTKLFGPVCYEIVRTKWLTEKFRSVILKARVVV
jgi:hypothetical protein